MSHFDNTTITTTTNTNTISTTTPKAPDLLQPKNKKSKLPKRIRVTDPSGWTHIIRGSKAQKKQSYIKPMAHLKPREVAANMTTVEKACMRLKGYAGDWEKSECREKMEEMMEEDVLMSDKVNISNCVCLGLGSLTGVNGSKSSWYELVTLIWILEILGMYTYTYTARSPHPLIPPSPLYYVAKVSPIPSPKKRKEAQDQGCVHTGPTV